MTWYKLVDQFFILLLVVYNIGFAINSKIIEILGLEIYSNIFVSSLIIILYLLLTAYRYLLYENINIRNMVNSTELPSVSIILPIRNEENNIKTCLKNLLTLNYPIYEIIIADGSSTDKSIEIANKTINNFNENNIVVNIIEEEELPDDWLGKSWGCWNAAKIANGNLYLFTDADTIHSKNSLNVAVEKMLEMNLDGLSIIGKMMSLSVIEKIIMPSFKSLIFLIFGGRYGSKYLRDLAIGQYILVKKETYDGFGGHKVIKDKIAEDIHLASKISSIGSFKSFNGNKIYSVRMYSNYDEILNGLSRNANESMSDKKIGSIIAVFSLLIWKVIPLITLPVFILEGYDGIEVIGLFCIFSIGSILVDVELNDDKLYYLFILPIGLVLLSWILIDNIFFNRAKEISWKGREYNFNE